MPFSDHATQAVHRRFVLQPRGLQDHLRRVADMAERIAAAHGLDAERAAVAALAHDLARAFPARKLLSEAARLGTPVDPVERAVPVLLHGPVAADILAKDDGVEDPDLLEAVRWHSTAAPGIGPIAKVTFLADKLDPEKADRFPNRDEVLALALTDLDGAVVAYIARELVSLAQQGQLLHPSAVAARNEILLRRA